MAVLVGEIDSDIPGLRSLLWSGRHLATREYCGDSALTKKTELPASSDREGNFKTHVSVTK
jgi:hypothetical protein